MLQVEKVVEIGRSAIGDDGNDAQIVAIVENFRHLVGERHVGAGELTAGDADGPVVLAQLHCSVAATLFEGFGHRLRLRAGKPFDAGRTKHEDENQK